ncbi:MAG: NADPH-dependent assimilatory sulfite reductase hemoprotein subunit, partial [bacterium]|nr:NADPH-dependent assimilatory sulfite reductase hemoprotein subunit [bacterium]
MSSAEKSEVSAVEVFKDTSDFLRGDIGSELIDENDFFGKGSVQLLKHHGTYQQDDRDSRGAKTADGKKKGKAYMFMVRTRIPAGILTSAQLLAEIDMCDELGNNTLRITSRQGLQLHGIVKNDLHATIRRINEIQLSTLGACGDVERNIMCCPAPYKAP